MEKIISKIKEFFFKISYDEWIAIGLSIFIIISLTIVFINLINRVYEIMRIV